MFNLDDTLYEIIKKYPEALDFFIANGFEQLKNKQISLRLWGKILSCEWHLCLKRLIRNCLLKNWKCF